MLPADWAFVPGAQGLQTETAESAAVPAGQTAQLELEALATLPGAHDAHDVADAELKVPEGQTPQADPLRKLPAVQDEMFAPLSIV